LCQESGETNPGKFSSCCGARNRKMFFLGGSAWTVKKSRAYPGPRLPCKSRAENEPSRLEKRNDSRRNNKKDTNKNSTRSIEFTWGQEKW
jgi:hypothetical protein